MMFVGIFVIISARTNPMRKELNSERRVQLVTHDELARRWEWSLEKKVEETKKRIVEWYEAFDGKVAVSFSGGRDSTVLLSIARSLYPDMVAVFCNTGLEYPEIVDFVKTKRNVKTIRPAMPFHKVIKKWGFPVISKRTAQYLHEVRNAKTKTPTYRLRMTGIKSNGKFSKMSMIPFKWHYLIDAPFKISNMCCSEIKKKPLNLFLKMTGLVPFVGTMADEGQQRKSTYLKYGCNLYDSKHPRSTPMSFWTHSDVLEYIKSRGLPYSKIYDMGHESTGCMFCMFGVHLDQKRTGTNRFILMEKTHPKQWEYCIKKLGVGRVMDYIGVPYSQGQLQEQTKIQWGSNEKEQAQEDDRRGSGLVCV